MSAACPTCGVAVPADAPHGLCPRCLLRSSPATAAFGPFTPPSVDELAPHFPHLQIIDLLGAGGMGAVYKACQAGLDRLVALKVLPHRDDPAFAERFTREARTLAKLSHPNIVTVYDFGQTAGLFYFIMEYVDGINLREAERSGKMTPAEGLAVIPQICTALQFAHEAGVVHRDIKPENILLDAKGRVKIADFGLAKLLGGGPAGSPLTHTNQVVGTFHYIAPEQWERPAAVDHRADIYSLGVVFYELLTGELPLGRFPLPSEKVRVDVRLDEVVLRTLEKQPERRYQHAGDVKTDVERIAGTPPAEHRTADRPAAGPTADAGAGRRLAAASAALFLVGLATCVIGLAAVGWAGVTLARIAAAPTGEQVSKSGGATVTARPTGTGPPAWAVVTLLVEQTLALGAGGMIVLAALSMRRPEHHGLARAGCVLAMAPLSPVWPAGLPIGIRALSVLRSPAARTAEPAGWYRPGGVAIASMAGLLVGTLTTFLPWARLDVFGFPLTFYGFDRWYGLVTGGACVAGLLVLASTELLHPGRAWRAGAPLAAGLVVCGVTAAYFAEMFGGTTVTSTQTQGDPALKGLADVFVQQMVGGMDVRPHVGPYAAAVVGVVLTGLGLFGLRRRPEGALASVGPAEPGFARHVAVPIVAVATVAAAVVKVAGNPSAGGNPEIAVAVGAGALFVAVPIVIGRWLLMRGARRLARRVVLGWVGLGVLAAAAYGTYAYQQWMDKLRQERDDRQRQLIGTWDYGAGGRLVFRTDGTFAETYRETVPDVGPNEPNDPEKTRWVERDGQWTWHDDGVNITMKVPGQAARFLKPVFDGDALTLLESDGRVWRLRRAR